jgi:hypothetical protein
VTVARDRANSQALKRSGYRDLNRQSGTCTGGPLFDAWRCEVRDPGFELKRDAARLHAHSTMRSVTKSVMDRLTCNGHGGVRCRPGFARRHGGPSQMHPRTGQNRHGDRPADASCQNPAWHRMVRPSRPGTASLPRHHQRLKRDWATWGDTPPCRHDARLQHGAIRGTVPQLP